MKLSFENLLIELGVTTHFKERLNDRVFNSDLKTNLLYYIDGVRHIDEIGSFKIPDDIISIIKQNIELITDSSVNKNITFAVYIYKFKLNDVWNNTKLYNVNDMNKFRNILKIHKGRLTISDNSTKTYGTSLVGIIKKGTLITTYYENSNTKEYLYNKIKKGKFSNDDLIVLDSPEEIEYYYVSKDRNLNALH
jgi:hypothetical protein